MNRKILIILAVIIVLISGIFIMKSRVLNKNYLYKTHPVEQRKQIYHCPMHPNYTSNKPGDCPICNMKLVPIEEKPSIKEMSKTEGVPDRETVIITSKKRQLIGVKTDTVKRRNIIKSIRTVGRVAYDPELYYALQEYITSLKRYDQIEKAGISVNGEKDRLKTLIDAAKFKLKLLGLSEDQINELSSKDEPDTSLLITEGSQTVWIYAQIYEYDISSIRRGQEAKITLPYNSSEIFLGKVIAIDPVLNPETRSVRVRILTDNRSNMLKPEVYVNIEIKVPVGNFLTIPSDSVLDTGTRQIVFIDKGEGVFEPRKVILGEKIDDYYVLKSGISEHEKVVTSANFLIDSESQLKSALKQMTAEHKH